MQLVPRGNRPFSAAGCSPGNPLCAGAESPKSAPQRASGSPVQPCGLVCEVMACRSGHTGRGLVGLGLCSAFPARPQDRYTVFRDTPRSLEISAALTSLSRSSWLAQGPVTANLAPAWSTAVTVPCTLTTAPVSTQWRSAAARVPAVRPPESSGLADGEAGPVLGDLGDPIDAAGGVRVWRRSHLGPDAAGVSPPGPRAPGLRRRIPPRPCGAGNPPGSPVFPQLCVRGRWGQPCSPERWAPPSQHSPGQAERPGSIAEVAWDRPGLGLLRGEWSP